MTIPQPHFLYHPGYAAVLAPALLAIDTTVAANVRNAGTEVLRGWLVAGRPGFSLYPIANLAFETPTFPGTTATYGDLVPRGLSFMLAHHPGDLAHKVLRLTAYYGRQVWFTVNPLVVLAFVAALVLRAGAPAVRRLAEFTALELVVTAASAVLVAGEPRYLAPFAPLLIVLGAGAAVRAAQARQAWPRMFGAPLPADYVPPAFTLVREFADGAKLYRRRSAG